MPPPATGGSPSPTCSSRRAHRYGLQARRHSHRTKPEVPVAAARRRLAQACDTKVVDLRQPFQPVPELLPTRRPKTTPCVGPGALPVSSLCWGLVGAMMPHLPRTKRRISVFPKRPNRISGSLNLNNNQLPTQQTQPNLEQGRTPNAPPHPRRRGIERGRRETGRRRAQMVAPACPKPPRLRGRRGRRWVPWFSPLTASV